MYCYDDTVVNQSTLGVTVKRKTHLRVFSTLSAPPRWCRGSTLPAQMWKLWLRLCLRNSLTLENPQLHWKELFPVFLGGVAVYLSCFWGGGSLQVCLKSLTKMCRQTFMVKTSGCFPVSEAQKASLLYFKELFQIPTLEGSWSLLWLICFEVLVSLSLNISLHRKHTVSLDSPKTRLS